MREVVACERLSRVRGGCMREVVVCEYERGGRV